jgi:alpha/beta superfamily hydrolase
MTAFFFGDSASPLFGVWSQPSDGLDRDHGVLLCPPIAQEHVRTHWAFRQATTALCRAGFHCLRFDWFGVGDSAGDLRHATLARWKADLATAAQELRDAAGVRSVSLVGLRFGATVAALGWEDVRPSSLVLWDPIVCGREYAASLEQLTRKLLTDPLRYWDLKGARSSQRGELVGFDFGADLLAEIERTELSPAMPLPDAPVCLLRSSSDPQLEVLGERLRASPAGAEVHDAEMQAKWESPKDVEELLLPGDAIRLLTNFLKSHAT